MKISTLRIIFIAPILLSIPMMCMHLGDGHHNGGHHSLQYPQSSLHDSMAGSTTAQQDISSRRGDPEER